MGRQPLLRLHPNRSGTEPSSKVCILKPNAAVYDVGVLGEGHHRHSGGLYGFFDCEGDLVQRWPKKRREEQCKA